MEIPMVFAEMDAEESGAPSEVFDVVLEPRDTVRLAEVQVRYDLSVMQSLRRIVRAVSLYSHQLAATYKITAPQLVCLLTIVNEGPLNLSRLSKQVFLSASTVVGILDRLEEKGLITRQRNQKDRRLIHVQATPKGEALIAQTPSPLPTALANALKQLPELEQATIALSLERVVDLMEARCVQDTPEAKDTRPEGI
jgi:DNA-binding MarR family transcriptional regulator